ncbi:MAG: hypothetical protein CMJ35_04875 [Phycisphaerae bacterium]|nr:hypothetical protein [Phycisphaerae bacterium]
MAPGSVGATAELSQFGPLPHFHCLIHKVYKLGSVHRHPAMIKWLDIVSALIPFLEQAEQQAMFAGDFNHQIVFINRRNEIHIELHLAHLLGSINL